MGILSLSSLYLISLGVNDFVFGNCKPSLVYFLTKSEISLSGSFLEEVSTFWDFNVEI